MKKILITGAGSFVGMAVQKHLKSFADRYEVQTAGTRAGEWKDLDFSSFDTVYHVAGLAHSDVGNVTEEIKAKYYAINTDLAVDVAKKAKSEGVKQFIFMSSAIVYGDSAPIGVKKMSRGRRITIRLISMETARSRLRRDCCRYNRMIFMWLSFAAP